MMLATLQELPVSVKRAFGRRVGMSELTRVAVALSRRAWMVQTNRAVYTIRRTAFGWRADNFSLDMVGQLEVADYVVTITGKDRTRLAALTMDRGKKGVVEEAIAKVNAYLNSPGDT